MNTEQIRRMHEDKGFIAALDQSGGSTPKALSLYGIPENSYSGEKEMFDLVHAMRSRLIASPVFTGDFILGVILFEGTMLREVEGEPTPDYLWNRKKIVPFLKIDDGLAEAGNQVQLMKPIAGLAERLAQAKEKRIFGTKMRSVIHGADQAGIDAVVAQQFEIAEKILAAGLVPIIEPEVDIHSPDKKEAETILKKEIAKRLSAMSRDARVLFKLSLPDVDDFYAELLKDEKVVRVVALSGGYSQAEADTLLARNHGVVASFSRALLEGLAARQSPQEFDKTLSASIKAIYQASVT